MADYNKEWERTKAYLIRSLFHSVPHSALSTITEESTQSSSIVYKTSSTDDSYDPSEESLETVPSPATPASRPVITHINDSPERERSPLPLLIIEREPNKHDESEEYYDKLLIKMKRICRKLYLERRSMSEDDFFIDSDNDENANISEQIEGHNNTYAESFDVEEELNNIRHESDINDDLELDIDQANINNSTYDSFRDLQCKLTMEDSASTDPDNPQFIQRTVCAVVNAENEEQYTQDATNVLYRQFTVDNTSHPTNTQHLPVEVPASPSRNLLQDSTLSPLFRESLMEIATRKCGSSPIQIESDNQEISFSRTSIGRERSRSPILICPYIPIKRMKKAIDLPSPQDSEDSHSPLPHCIEMTIQAEVHVDADFYCQDTLLVGFKTEQQIDVTSTCVQHLSPEVQINTFPVFPRDSTRTCAILYEQNLSTQSPNGVSFNRQTSVNTERSQSPVLVCHFIPQNHSKQTKDSRAEIKNEATIFSEDDVTILEEIQDPNPTSSSISNEIHSDERIEEMRSSQRQTSNHSDRIQNIDDPSDVDITFAYNSQVMVEDINNITSQDSSTNNHSNINTSLEQENYNNDNPRGKKRSHENSSSKSYINLNTSSYVINDDDSYVINETCSIDPDSPQLTQMTVRAMVHVDAHFHSQETPLVETDRDPQHEVGSSLGQESMTDVQPRPLAALSLSLSQSPLRRHTLEQIRTRKSRILSSQMITASSPRTLCYDTKTSDSRDLSKNLVLECQNIPNECFILQSQNTATCYEFDGPNGQQSQEMMVQDVDSELHQDRRHALNNKENDIAIRLAQPSLPNLQLSSTALQNDSPLNVVFEEIFEQTISRDCRMSPSYIKTNLSPQEVLSASLSSVGAKHSQSPILTCQYVPHKGMKPSVDALVHRNNENPDKTQCQAITLQTIDHADANVHTQDTSAINRELQNEPSSTSPCSALHRASTQSPLFEETLEKTLERMCGISPSQNLTAQSTQDVSCDIEASKSRERSRSPILVCRCIPTKRSKQTLDSVAEHDARTFFLLRSSRDCGESDKETTLKSYSSSENSSDEEGVAISTCEEDQDPSSSSSSAEQICITDNHTEEMRSSQPHASTTSLQIDDINSTSDMDLNFLCNTHVIPHDTTSQSQKITDNELTNSTNNVRNSDYINPRSRKRKHGKIACQNKIDWDALGNIFVGDPKIFKLCTHEDYLCQD